MSVCVTVTRLFLDPRNVFPVLDPRRTAGTGPYKYGYMLTWDGLQVTVTRDPALSNCEMTVVATAATLLPPEKMDIWGLNLFSNAWTTGVGTAATGLPTDMRIRRRGRLGQSCNDGTDTVLLRCSKERGIWPASEYLFAPEDFWDFWGGCTVQFDWVSNTSGSGLLGNQTPAPTYPMVRRPDGTFMRQDIPIDEDHETQKYFVVFGGAAFLCGYGDLFNMGLHAGNATPYVSLPSTPADFTVVRELFRPEFYVVYGGAKFLIRDTPTLWSLTSFGGMPPQVRVIPPGSSSQLRTLPIDGTLVREQNDPKVYLAENNKLRWVTSPTAMQDGCLSWRHVRIVPDNSLAALPRGPNFGPSYFERPHYEFEQWARPPPSSRRQGS
jgi:hypothetical protein